MHLEMVYAHQGRHLPLYASQFHPEKNAFEFDQTWDSAAVAEQLHASDAIQVTMSERSEIDVLHTRQCQCT